MPDAPRLFLIDGHALAYRAYFALTRAGDGSRWITKAGESTAGTYGFVSVLLRLLESQAPEYLAVSFDTGRTFRDDLYPEYKATRDKMPDDLRLQLDRIRQVVLAFGIPILEAEGFEADDVLGTVARRAAEQGVRVVILSGDRDLLQLVDDFDPRRAGRSEALGGNRLWAAGRLRQVRRLARPADRLQGAGRRHQRQHSRRQGHRREDRRRPDPAIRIARGDLPKPGRGAGTVPHQARARPRAGLFEPPAGDHRARGPDRVRPGGLPRA